MQSTCQYASAVLPFQALADNCRNPYVTFALSISNVCKLYHTKVHQILIRLSPLGSNLIQAGVSETSESVAVARASAGVAVIS